MAKKIQSGELEPVSETLDLKMYNRGCQQLKAAGYHHYEISNFAQPRAECCHNQVYWHYQPYLGLGVAAHSFSGTNRFYNYASREKYLSSLAQDKLPLAEVISLSLQDLQAEMIIMGLRLLSGINKDDFQKRFGETLKEVYGKEIKKLTRKKLLINTAENIRLTAKGLRLGNYVFRQFLPEK